jgi:hypothetical protein
VVWEAVPEKEVLVHYHLVLQPLLGEAEVLSSLDSVETPSICLNHSPARKRLHLEAATKSSVQLGSNCMSRHEPLAC